VPASEFTPANDTRVEGIITGTEAATIAQREMQARGWADTDVQRVEYVNGWWQVRLAQMPRRIGAHGTVVISGQGEVIKFQGGL
jgi:hypothetical protein